MDEQEIRALAHQRNDKGRDYDIPSRDKNRIGGEGFRDRVAGYINGIPIDPTKLKMCLACEGVLCGLCGQCHELDRRNWHNSRACPVAHYMHQDDACRAWTYAYLFLKDAKTYLV